MKSSWPSCCFLKFMLFMHKVKSWDNHMNSEQYLNKVLMSLKWLFWVSSQKMNMRSAFSYTPNQRLQVEGGQYRWKWRGGEESSSAPDLFGMDWAWRKLERAPASMTRVERGQDAECIATPQLPSCSRGSTTSKDPAQITECGCWKETDQHLKLSNGV